MDIKDLIKHNRSYRRFDANHAIKQELLLELVDLTRYTASSRNSQSLRYFLSTDKKTNDNVFETLSWAGYLRNWDGPSEKERPTAYIVVVAEEESLNQFTMLDTGLATQSILLGAVDKGLGGCIVAAVRKEKLRKIIHLNDKYEIICVIALGKPNEQVFIESMEEDDIRYWRDTEDVHHVPKRKLEDIILN